MNSKERQIERDKKISEILDKVDLILDHLGIDEDQEEGENE